MVVYAEMTIISLSLTRSIETRVIQGTKGSDDKIYVKYMTIYSYFIGRSLYRQFTFLCAIQN